LLDNLLVFQDSSNRKRSLPEVKILLESEVADYKVTDVVLPLPGNMVTYPDNMKDYYVKLLREDKLNFEVFNHKVKYVYLSIIALVMYYIRRLK